LTEALREVKDNGITHLSLYQLTMEEGTAMYAAHKRGAFALPDEDTAAALYERTQELCAEAGLPAYEISNHAAADAACRHNLTYWRGGDYVGVGPGAHGRITAGGITTATSQYRTPARWLKKVETEGHGTQVETAIAPAARAEELVMMSLRTAEGIDKARFQRLAGRSLEQVVDGPARDRLVADGFLMDRPDRLQATPKGHLALNALLRALLV
jgi:oxygen-independent coproporphyrinogen-3 oxidase